MPRPVDPIDVFFSQKLDEARAAQALARSLRDDPLSDEDRAKLVGWASLTPEELAAVDPETLEELNAGLDEILGEESDASVHEKLARLAEAVQADPAMRRHDADLAMSRFRMSRAELEELAEGPTDDPRSAIERVARGEPDPPPGSFGPLEGLERPTMFELAPEHHREAVDLFMTRHGAPGTAERLAAMRAEEERRGV